MEARLITRPADSPFVHSITHWTIGTDDTAIATPDGCWDFVVLKRDTQTTILLTGQTTIAVPLNFAPGDEIMTISFKASAFLAFITSSALLDHAIILSKTHNSVQLASDVFEIPTFANAEAFAQSLVSKGHLYQDDVVEALLANHPLAYSPRSVQRHFMRTTGMTYTYFRQIQRARRAAALLQSGHLASEVAYESGYADQAHMSRSLKRILGQTPTVLATLQRP